jgi:hypothetical protein
MTRLGASLLVLGIIVWASASLVPIRGNDLGVADESVTCGPALGAAMRWTGPGADEATSGEVIRTGSDTGITKAAWCEGEAGRWMRPSYLAAAMFALVGPTVLAVRVLSRGRLSRPARDA